jgi:lincosamide nucleotidyltransferase A/C/D/E
MVTAGQAIQLYETLVSHGFHIWLNGGWGVDALLGEQGREHKDLDMLVLRDEVLRLRALLAEQGFELKELWEENKQVLDVHGEETATAFVLRDALEREIDAHALVLDGDGNGLPAWEAEPDFRFSPQDLDGEGWIAGVKVRCISPNAQMFCHSGYVMPEKQAPELERLHARFGVALPEEYYNLRPRKEAGGPGFKKE